MNKCIYMGRLTRDPEVRYSQDNKAVARYTVAVDRVKTQNNPNPGADFISCVAFGRSAEFAEKYLKKGMKILVEGHTQTGFYEKDGQKIYTTECIIEKQEFAEGKKDESQTTAGDDFMNIPNVVNEELPFN